MVVIDDQDWPLVLVRWDVPISTMDTDFCSDCLAAWMKRSQRFAVLSIQPSELAGMRQQNAFKSAADFGTRLSHRCAGIALTWPDGRRSERAGIQEAERLSEQLRCPVRAFPDSDAALHWLRAQLALSAPISVASQRRSVRMDRRPP